MKHIVFIGSIGFFKRDYERFNIKLFKKNFKISFIDLTKIYNKQFYTREKKNFFYHKCLKIIGSVSEFKNFLKNNKINFFIDICPDNENYNIIKEIINKNKIKLIGFQLTLYPNFKRTFIIKLKFFFRIIFFNRSLLLFYFKNFIKKLKKKNLQKINFYYNYLFYCGKHAESLLKDQIKYKKIYCHSFDYENYLVNKKNINLRLKSKNNLVFLDQYLPYHNGYKIRNIPPFVTSKNYYDSLNNFFDLLERKLNTEIIISIHPRSNWKIIKKKFNGRKLFNYKNTNKLVSDSQGVITYSSTAINYAIIYKKPIIFYTSNEINSSHDAYMVNFLSNIIGSKLINIDSLKNMDASNLLKIDKVKYKTYETNYICHTKSKNISNYQKLNNLLSLNDENK